jgi:hypothetical protein
MASGGALWQRSTAKKICGERFYAVSWKERNTAMRTPTKFLSAMIRRGLMLFSATDSATRRFSAGRVTARQCKGAWPRVQVNRQQSFPTALPVLHRHGRSKMLGDQVAHCPASTSPRFSLVGVGHLSFRWGRGFLLAAFKFLCSIVALFSLHQAKGSQHTVKGKQAILQHVPPKNRKFAGSQGNGVGYAKPPSCLPHAACLVRA